MALLVITTESGVAQTSNAPDTVLVSRADGVSGTKANDTSMAPSAPSISLDARFVAFGSNATNLDPADTDTTVDVYVRDRESATTELVSRASGTAGTKGNGSSGFPSVSADGRFVAFSSQATNLSPDDSDTYGDVFVRDRQAGTTTLVSRASGSTGAKGDNHSGGTSMSADGRYVAFSSNASNLHPDDTDSDLDVFVRDLQTGTTILASRPDGSGGTSNGSSGSPSLSADGRFVAFTSSATNLVADDTDTMNDVYVRDLQAGTTVLASRADGVTGVKADKPSSDPAISAGGRFVVFSTEASNLTADDTDAIEDVYVRDLQEHTTMLVSRASGATGASGNGSSRAPAISADGKVVTFSSNASNLHPDDTDAVLDVFARVLREQETVLVSRAAGANGSPANGASYFPSTGMDGRFVAFVSNASNLHPDDPDTTPDWFVRGPLDLPGEAIRIFGADRYATAANVAREQFGTGPVPQVFLTTGTTFPDALAGGPLAAISGAPILLTEPTTLPSATVAVLGELVPSRVVALGGPAAVSADVLHAAASAAGGATTGRIAGEDRYATAAEVARALPAPATVWLATGTNFPDALAGGPAAAQSGAAILLTDPATLPRATADVLAELAPASVLALGGPAAVSDQVLAAAAAAAGGASTGRISGSDRFDTAVEIAKRHSNPSAVYVATGATFPDALAGGPVAAMEGAVVVLTGSDELPQVSADYVASLPEVKRIVVLGGSAAISDGVLAQLRSLLD